MNSKERSEQAKGIYKAGQNNVANSPAPKGQRFPVGAFVKIAEKLGSMMSHFPSNKYARVECTYAHAYPDFGGSDKDYSLHVQFDDGSWSTSSWYHENQLTEVTDPVLIDALKASFDKS